MRSTHRFAITALALAIGCQAGDRTPEEQANAEAILKFADAYNAQGPGWFEDHHAPEYEWEGLGPWAPAGHRVSYEQMLGMIGEEARHGRARHGPRAPGRRAALA